MTIFVIGVNHKTTPLELRERIYFALEKIPLYLQDLLASGYAKEAVLLSTCNRSELYCEAENLQKVRDWFIAQTPFSAHELAKNLYHYANEDAINHIMTVACGLDSMVIGEAQILGQMKQAFSESCAVAAIGPAFHRLFQSIFNVAKEIRTSTAIGACPVSMVSAAVHFAKTHAPSFVDAHILVIGAGETAQLLLRYLNSVMPKKVTLLNRTPERALESIQNHLQLAFTIEIGGLEDIPHQLRNADILFSMTGSAQPIIQRAMVAAAMQKREQQPFMLIDIAVPRDIEPEVNEIDGVNLYCIDDLKSIIETNRRGREHAAEKARELIQQQSSKIIAEYRSFDHVADTIRLYRKQIEAMCRQELNKARIQLAKGVDPAIVLESFAYAYTNKLLHEPSVQLRKAGNEGKFELLRYAKQLFAISDLEVEHI